MSGGIANIVVTELHVLQVPHSSRPRVEHPGWGTEQHVCASQGECMGAQSWLCRGRGIESISVAILLMVHCSVDDSCVKKVTVELWTIFHPVML